MIFWASMDLDFRPWGLMPQLRAPAVIDRFSDFIEKAFPWIFWVGMISLGTIAIVIAQRQEQERSPID